VSPKQAFPQDRWVVNQPDPGASHLTINFVDDDLNNRHTCEVSQSQSVVSEAGMGNERLQLHLVRVVKGKSVERHEVSMACHVSQEQGL